MNPAGHGLILLSPSSQCREACEQTCSCLGTARCFGICSGCDQFGQPVGELAGIPLGRRSIEPDRGVALDPASRGRFDGSQLLLNVCVLKIRVLLQLQHAKRKQAGNAIHHDACLRKRIGRPQEAIARPIAPHRCPACTRWKGRSRHCSRDPQRFHAPFVLAGQRPHWIAIQFWIPSPKILMPDWRERPWRLPLRLIRRNGRCIDDANAVLRRTFAPYLLLIVGGEEEQHACCRQPGVSARQFSAIDLRQEM